MACRLAGAKPLSESMLEYCQLDPWEQNFTENLVEIYIFSLKKMHLKMSPGIWRPFCLIFNVLVAASGLLPPFLLRCHVPVLSEYIHPIYIYIWKVIWCINATYIIHIHFFSRECLIFVYIICLKIWRKICLVTNKLGLLCGTFFLQLAGVFCIELR